MTTGRRTDRPDLAEQSRAAADAVWTFLLPGYGPHGGHRLLDLGDDVQILKSPASGLNEQALDAALAPYQDLARAVRSAVGDQATVAALLAAGLVRRGLDAAKDGLPRPVLVDGLETARRQVMATLRSLRTKQGPAVGLQHTTALGGPAVQAVLDGLASWAPDAKGVLDLDAVDIVADDAGPEWSMGCLARPQQGPDERRRDDAVVLVVDGGWRLTPRSSDLSWRATSVEDVAAGREEEQARRKQVLDRVAALGVGLAVCGGSVDDDVKMALVGRGVWVWTDAPKDARRRIAACTGATPVPDLDHVDGGASGRADLRRRPRRLEGLWVMGPAPAATLLLPAHTEVARASVLDDGERLLRAAGAFLDDPDVVPGGGRWQRHVEDSLHRAMDHASGKQPIAVRVARKVFRDVADALVANAGMDPIDRRLLPDAEEVWDPVVCVDEAVDAAFATAIVVLRIDGRFDKRPSTPEGLRGGTGSAGSPKGMPGDVPPLM